MKSLKESQQSSSKVKIQRKISQMSNHKKCIQNYENNNNITNQNKNYLKQQKSNKYSPQKKQNVQNIQNFENPENQKQQLLSLNLKNRKNKEDYLQGYQLNKNQQEAILFQSLPKIKYRMKTQGTMSKKTKQFNDMHKRLEMIKPYWSQIKKAQKRVNTISILNNNYNHNYSLNNLDRNDDKRNNKTQELSRNKINLNFKKYSLKQESHSFSKAVSLKNKPQARKSDKKDLNYQSIQVKLNVGKYKSDREFINQNQNINHNQKKRNDSRKIVSENNNPINHSERNVINSSKSKKLSYTKLQARQIQHLKLKKKVNNVIENYYKNFEKISSQQNQLSNSREAKQQQKKKQMTWRFKKHYQIIQQFKKLPRNKQQLDVSQITNFIACLKSVNPIFERVNQLTAQVFIRFLKIKLLQKNQILYFQGNKSKIIYIVLWGQFLLKNQDQSFIKYAMPGDSMSQQLLFINSKKSKFSSFLSIPKQSYYHLQSSKSLTQSAVLYFTQKQYQQVCKDLIKCGMKFKKDLVLIENMMKWCYSKKYNARASIIC